VALVFMMDLAALLAVYYWVYSFWMKRLLCDCADLVLFLMIVVVAGIIIKIKYLINCIIWLGK
jgi:hypothetical protein